MNIFTGHKTLILITATAAFLSNGCGHSILHRQMTEGVIEYALSFPDYDPNGLMAGMLPEKTTLTFNEDHQVAELSAGMGVFKTSMVANTDKKILDYQLSVLSKKLVAELHPRDLGIFNKDSQALTIIYTGITDSIAGYQCKKAIAIYNNINQPEVDLWYTDAIHIEDPNWFGPYSEIPGLLLRYEVMEYGMRMRLDATSVKPGPVDPIKFQLKADHQKVTPEVLHNELAEVLSTFTS
jgi:GLPGLI family protein